jgi:hypothetical protein
MIIYRFTIEHMSLSPPKFAGIAKLLENEETFNQAFDTSLKTTDHEALIEESKYFFINNRRHQFKDNDPIFFIEQATPSRNLEKGKADCQSCGSIFKSIKTVCYW